FNHEQERLKMAQLGLQVIRQLVRAGSIIAPRLTGNLMFERFCTPPRAPRLAKVSARQLIWREPGCKMPRAPMLPILVGVFQLARSAPLCSPASMRCHAARWCFFMVGQVGLSS
ncbi:MAG: hypothetical protein ACOVN4_11295, partial [Bosea sp. (in: a-proteobacteria)]